jgi:hypothetical protein
MITLRPGTLGQEVAAWQGFLGDRGLLPGAQSGVFDGDTQRATRLFQSSRRLIPDGVVGPATLKAATALGFLDRDQPPSPPAPPRIQGSTPHNDFYPPKPSFPPLIGDTERRAVFGNFAYDPAPSVANPDAIKVTDGWAAANIVTVTVPGLAGITVGGTHAHSGGRVSFHRKAAAQLIALWSAWNVAGLLGRILTFDGAYNPRFQRGSHTRLSNHAFGTAFDINAQQNPFHKPVAPMGKPGCVMELVSLANQHGFYWGGHFSPSADGMHFEIAKLT